MQAKGVQFTVMDVQFVQRNDEEALGRIREQLVRGRAATVGEPPLSAGIVTYPHPAVTQADDLFALVEAALARGKAQSGERVGIAD